MGWTVFFIWLIIAVICVIIELVGTDFVFLMAGGGAVGAAVVGLFFPDSILLQVIAFAAVSALLLVLVRPALKRHLNRDLPATKMNIDAVVAQRCTVIEEVTRDSGRVLLNGNEWTAKSPTNYVYSVGETAYVREVDGASLVLELPPQTPNTSQ